MKLFDDNESERVFFLQYLFEIMQRNWPITFHVIYMEKWWCFTHCPSTVPPFFPGNKASKVYSDLTSAYPVAGLRPACSFPPLQTWDLIGCRNSLWFDHCGCAAAFNADSPGLARISKTQQHKLAEMWVSKNATVIHNKGSGAKWDGEKTSENNFIGSIGGGLFSTKKPKTWEAMTCTLLRLLTAHWQGWYVFAIGDICWRNTVFYLP